MHFLGKTHLENQGKAGQLLLPFLILVAFSSTVSTVDSLSSNPPNRFINQSKKPPSSAYTFGTASVIEAINAMFEPAHGSAPKYKGMDKVNPTAAILSGAWMAEYLGEPEIRNAIFEATEQIINEGKFVTYDIGGNAKTSQMAEEIAKLAKQKLGK